MTQSRLTARLRRHVRMRVMAALALIALSPLVLLALMEKAMTAHMSLSFSSALMLGVAAAALVWWIADRHLLRPMLALIDHVAAADAAAQSAEVPGDDAPPHQPLAMPQGKLRVAESMHLASRQLERDQVALESARALHQRLTREIHHRVKNNLQIIVSLLNLHQRGAAHEPGAASAFRTIQQRVEALTAVHRNLVASAEVEQGIALSRLLDDIAAIFGDGGGVDAPMDVTIDAPVTVLVSQDAALPAAFLLTELAAVAQRHDPGSHLVIAARADSDERVRLVVTGDAFALPACDALVTSGYVARILAGMARQLGASLDRSADRRSFAILLPVIAE